MAKVINLIPSTVKHERNIKKAKMSVVYVTLMCAGATLGMNQYENHLEKQINQFNAIISEYKNRSTELENIQKKIDETIALKNSISRSSFPYHRFLYFLSVNATEDMRILSVESVSPEEEKNVENGQNGNTNNDASNNPQPIDNSGSPTNQGNNGGQQTNNPPQQNNGNQQAQNPENGSQDPNQAQNQNPQQGSGNQASGDPNGAILENDQNGNSGAQSGNNGQNNNGNAGENSETHTANPFDFEISDIYIRGYAIYPDSIAILANALKKEEYISSVVVTNIKDYFTGLQNFKLFEIKITYRQ